MIRRLLPLFLLSVLLVGCGGSTRTVTVTAPHAAAAVAQETHELLAQVEGDRLIPAGKIAVRPESARHPDAYAPLPPKLQLVRGTPPLSARGARFIESFEGFGSCPYWDAYGRVWTRGFGETEGIHSYSSCISRSFAERNLIYRAERFYGWAIVQLHGNFNANEVAAMYSFLWNLGAGIAPPGSTLARAWVHHDPYPMLGYDHAGGVVLAGLARRRRAEVALFRDRSGLETAAQHRARVHRERVAKLHADRRYLRRLDHALAAGKCLHGYRGFTQRHRHFCTVERARHAAVNRDIRRLRALGIR